MKRPAKSSARRPSRKKATVSTTAAQEEPTAAMAASEAPVGNVDPFEGKLSVVLGILFVITALFPRSIRQLLTLVLGGGLLYRGMTGHCGVYQALGIDSRKQPLLKL